MSSSTSPLSNFLDRFAADAEKLCQDTREQARRELAAELNLSVRRLRQSAGLDELAATLAETAARFVGGAILFHTANGVAKSARLDLEIPLTSAAALASAVESRDPVTAVTTAGEVSATLVERLGHAPDGRAHIYPVVVHDRVLALLYAWGDVQAAAVELLAQCAAAIWDQLQPPPIAELVKIAPAAPAAKAPSAWETLPPGEQRIHLRAQRFARVRVAEMRLREGAAVQAGRSQRNLYAALRTPIDATRAVFRSDFFASCPSMVDYLHLELVSTLANGNAELLGEGYDVMT